MKPSYYSDYCLLFQDNSLVLKNTYIPKNTLLKNTKIPLIEKITQINVFSFETIHIVGLVFIEKLV